MGDGYGGGDGSLSLFSSVVVHRVQTRSFVDGLRQWFGARDSDDYPCRHPERKARAEDGSAGREKGWDKVGGESGWPAGGKGGGGVNVNVRRGRRNAEAVCSVTTMLAFTPKTLGSTLIKLK